MGEVIGDFVIVVSNLCYAVMFSIQINGRFGGSIQTYSVVK